MSQPDGEAQGIDLPLALMQFGPHARQVLRPGTPGGTVVESVRVGIDQHAPGLAVDHAGQHPLQLWVLFHQGQVGPHLGRGIAQPHSVDVAGDHERVRLAIQFPGADRGVQGIRETVLEHPPQLRISDGSLHFFDAVLHRGARELALRQRRPLAGESGVRGQAGGLEA